MLSRPARLSVVVAWQDSPKPKGSRMAKVTQDTLEGYAFAVREEPRVVMDNGQPVFAQGSAEPTLEVITKLLLSNPDGSHVVVVPLNDDGKAALIRQLTGGVIVANGQPGA
jgi:hypothetical protein